ncbi:MAG: hypothetical protein OXI53_02060 [Nitrospira sp.]|nr:hypothetical protein [Nitrospira sp.]MDE0404080.1 hypothetical protein [Nitrospira sp.]MDE0487539.1 hypothetical protein [Nitrospira sp.]
MNGKLPETSPGREVAVPEASDGEAHRHNHEALTVLPLLAVARAQDPIIRLIAKFLLVTRMAEAHDLAVATRNVVDSEGLAVVNPWETP